MKFVRYIKSAAWEWILCTVIACGLSAAIFHGFYISASLQNNYGMIVGLTALLTAGCVCGGYDRRSTIVALSGGVAAAIVCVILMQQTTGIGGAFRDQESNPYLYFLILVLTGLITFFLSRTKTGTGILFVAGAFLISALQFLYESIQLPVLLLYVCGCGAMYIYKNYQKNVLESLTVKTAFGRSFATAVALCALIVAISAGAFYGIVRPLDPPKQDLKLITKYLSLEVLEKTGIADLNIINDIDELTNKDSDEEKQSSGEKDNKDKAKGDQEKKQNEDQKDEKNNPTVVDNLRNGLLYAIKYSWSTKQLILLLVPTLILLVALAVVMKLWWRQRWLENMMKQPKEEQIRQMYHFYLKKFRRLKIRKKPEETPLEFSRRTGPYMEAFQVEDVSFATLTDIFVKTEYGDAPASRKDHRSYLKFHKVFYQNCRTHLGKFKYMLKFFTL